MSQQTNPDAMEQRAREFAETLRGIRHINDFSRPLADFARLVVNAELEAAARLVDGYKEDFPVGNPGRDICQWMSDYLRGRKHEH